MKAVILDLDGTLVDTLGDFVAALNLMLRELRFDAVTPAEVRPLIGKGSEYLVAQVLALKSQSHIKTHTLGAGYMQLAANTAYQRHYRQINGQHSSVYPGVLDALTAWQRAGVPMACLTNKPLAFATELLRQKGLLGFFGHVFGGDSFERKKPDPLPVVRTCQALGWPVTDVLMVGDSCNDAIAARLAGCQVAWVSYGYNNGQAPQALPGEVVVASVAQLTHAAP